MEHSKKKLGKVVIVMLLTGVFSLLIDALPSIAATAVYTKEIFAADTGKEVFHDITEIAGRFMDKDTEELVMFILEWLVRIAVGAFCVAFVMLLIDIIYVRMRKKRYVQKAKTSDDTSLEGGSKCTDVGSEERIVAPENECFDVDLEPVSAFYKENQTVEQRNFLHNSSIGNSEKEG